jgi:excisionase family DNA binding protein
MKSRSTQFGVPENTASLRQHDSSVAVEIVPKTNSTDEEKIKTLEHASRNGRLAEVFKSPFHAATQSAATVREKRDENHLLTVHEVAELLRVPVSWVYEHTRGRCLDRIPGFRLGKYWRFSAGDVTAWIRSRRINDYHHD